MSDILKNQGSATQVIQVMSVIQALNVYFNGNRYEQYRY